MTSASLLLPNTDAVTQAMAMLLGSGLETTEAPAPLDLADAAVFGEYVDADGPRVVIAVDCPLANSLGAALTMVPGGIVNESIAEGIVPENLLENLHEVLNVCTSLVADGFTARGLRMTDTYVAGQLPEHTMALVTDAVARVDYQLNVPRYSGGRLTAFSLAGIPDGADAGAREGAESA